MLRRQAPSPICQTFTCTFCTWSDVFLDVQLSHVGRSICPPLIESLQAFHGRRDDICLAVCLKLHPHVVNTSPMKPSLEACLHRTPGLFRIRGDRLRCKQVREFEFFQPWCQETFADHLDVRFLEGPVCVEPAHLCLEHGWCWLRAIFPSSGLGAGNGNGNGNRNGGGFHVSKFTGGEGFGVHVDPFGEFCVGGHGLLASAWFVGACYVDSEAGAGG